MMTDKKWRKLNIFASIVLVLLILANIYVFCFRGAISDYRREQLGIFIPRFSADELIDESSFTDSLTFCCFKLNKKEVQQIKEDTENNPAWHIYSEDDEDFLRLLPDSETKYAVSKIDFTGCYIALYDYYNDCFITETEGLTSFICAVYDEENSMYYYFAMIW